MLFRVSVPETGGDGHSIGVRKIAIDKLTDWDSDIDKTIDLLKD